MERFPRDILSDIFSRLPLKPVICASCVSKSWFNIIKDLHFGKLHFSRSKSESSLLILKRSTIGNSNIISLDLLKHEGIGPLANGNTIVHMVSSHSWEFVGTCDGLVCFASSAKDDVIVCNPITRENFTLPKSVIDRPPHLCVPVLSFGFDPVENKYKVVRVCFPAELQFRVGLDRELNQPVRITAEVYTLGGVNSWRQVDGYSHHRPCGKPVYSRGAIYWMVNSYQNVFISRIMSFHLGREKFELIPHHKFGVTVTLFELGDSLSVADLSSTDLVEISVLKDSNLREVDRIIHIPKPSYLFHPVSRLIYAHGLNGVLIWLRDCLLFCEGRSENIKGLKIVDFPIRPDWEIFAGFRPSLVQLQEYSCELAEREDSKVRFLSDDGIYSLLAKCLCFWRAGRFDVPEYC